MTNASLTDKHWPSLISASAAAVVVGFASTILVVIEGVKAVGASPAQQASCAAILCLAMAATSCVLAIRYRQPIMVAWSTPGAVLLATSGQGVTFPEAIGAFLVAGVLMVLTGLIKPLADLINKMPAAIAGAMLAGVLLRYVLGVPGAAVQMPEYIVPLIFAFFALRLLVPIYAVPVIVGLGLLFAAIAGAFSTYPPIGITALTFDMPQFNPQVLIGIGIPLYLVTMASQNLPGFAVLQANGYRPPVQASLIVTGLGSMISSVFGGHAVNMAAITAAMVAGPDAHPDPGQRWKMIFPYTILYVIVGLAAGTFVAYLGAMPAPLVTAVAGLALFAPLMGGMSAMMKSAADVEPALLTFLVTASGFTLFGVGAAFWGLVSGIALWMIKKQMVRR
jgi:benzoate membrane transport protein